MITLKYKLTTDSIQHCGKTLHRIEALRSFANVNEGDKGGYVEKETNLPHYGDAWVYNNARVFGHARVFGNARVSGDAQVFGNAQVSGNAKVFGNAQVSDDAIVFGDANVCNATLLSNNSITKETNIKEKSVMKKATATKWTFKSRNFNDIDMVEISKDVTRKHPLAIVMVGEVAYLVVHQSLRSKLAAITEGYSRYADTLTDVYEVGEPSKLTAEIDKWKKVKRAPWPKAKTQIVTVSLLSV